MDADKYRRPKKLLTVLIVLAAAIWAMLLTVILISKNTAVFSPREESGSYTFTEVTSEEQAREDTPLGVVEEYTFTIPEGLVHDTALNFYLVHQYAEVWIDGECVYALQPSGSLPMIRTVGCCDISVPIYGSDAGKEVRVVVVPVYPSVRGRNVSFTLGSASAHVRTQIMSEAVGIFACFFLLICGVVMILRFLFKNKQDEMTRAGVCYGAAITALSLWKYFDLRTAEILLPGRSVFEYYLSLSMLMLALIPLMGIPERNERRRLYPGIYAAAVALLSIVSGILQIFGLADLRMFLPVIQAAALVGVVLLLLHSRFWEKGDGSHRLASIACVCMLVSVALDLVLYYVLGDPAISVVSVLALVFASGFMIFHYMDDYEQSRREVDAQKELVIRSRVSAMTGQIRSHFVFNILNAISGMCKYDPQKADRTIVCFARYLRANIDIMQNDEPVPFRTALAHLEDYLELERIRFGDVIRYEEDIGFDDFLIPPLVMQPLVENSVRHGLRPRPEGGRILLRTRLEADTIRVAVIDDGVGYTPGTEGEKSVGLSNVRARLQYMVGGRLEIDSAPGRGTTATIILPASAVLGSGGEETICG